MKDKNAASFDVSDEVFSRMANSYDTLCDLFSLFAHRYWKAHLAKKIVNTKGSYFLDIAAGTGDIGLRVAKSQSTNPSESMKEIVMGDICEKMLAVAEKKAKKQSITCQYKLLDAHKLESIPDNSVDILAISFAMKICERDRVLTTALRVLKPGGKFFCLEASKITNPWLHSFYLAYMRVCVPIIAILVTRGDSSAYNYLLKGIKEFPDQQTFSQEIESYGFENVKATALSLGIVSLHEASKPE